MKILCIGGTKFVGRKIVEDSLAAGHSVSILQRGNTNPHLFPEVRRYAGDRSDIAQLIPCPAEAEKWDLVVDTCGYHPAVVKIASDFLKDKARMYVFVSSASVYADFSVEGLTENSKTLELTSVPPVEEKISSKTYGALKALCEQEVLRSFGPERTLIVRPTIIVGAHDDSQRFDFWLRSILDGEGPLEVPDDPHAPIQFIDVRALSAFILNPTVNGTQGIFNLVGPKEPVRLLDFLKTSIRLLNPEKALALIPRDLPGHKSDRPFPMYVDEKDWGFFQISADKAYNEGLQNFSVEDTVRYTAQHLRSLRVQ